MYCTVHSLPSLSLSLSLAGSTSFKDVVQLLEACNLHDAAVIGQPSRWQEGLGSDAAQCWRERVLDAPRSRRRLRTAGSS